MSNTLPAPNTDAMTAFRERVLEKLRADIGSMLPDEALAGLVKQAVETEFFKERRIPQGSYQADAIKPSWFVEEVVKIGKPLIAEHITAWVIENKPVLEKATKDFLSDQNLMLLAMAALQDASRQQLYELANQIITMTKRGY